MSEYKSSLADVVKGDKVAMLVNYGTGMFDGYALVDVTHTTPTQIHIGHKKFRRSGRQIGGNSWESKNIYAPLERFDERSEKTYLDLVNEKIAAVNAERQRLVDLIKGADLDKIHVSRLKAAVRELGLK